MKIIFVVFSIVILGFSCKKEQLPAYYFMAKVDGKDYVPDKCANCLTAETISDTILILRGNRGFETLGIGINDGMGIRAITYNLNAIIGRRGDYKFSTTPADRYFTDSLRLGQLSITTLDKSNKVIAGTFSFQAYNKVQNKQVNVTEGRFRLQYKSY